MDKPN